MVTWIARVRAQSHGVVHEGSTLNRRQAMRKSSKLFVGMDVHTTIKVCVPFIYPLFIESHFQNFLAVQPVSGSDLREVLATLGENCADIRLAFGTTEQLKSREMREANRHHR